MKYEKSQRRLTSEQRLKIYNRAMELRKEYALTWSRIAERLGISMNVLNKIRRENDSAKKEQTS